MPLRVAHPVGKGHLADFALEVGAFALRYFADYYGITYPGEKLDLVAIPDFAFGAMENLGCVTFRERYVLIDPATATQAELQAVVDVIAHEIAHMWFGDLVTMKWWNGIWLNEAFATFMEMKGTDAFRPDWQRWVDFGLSRTAAFDTDALASTRPIEYPVVSPEDADGMFDVLTYEKGASVVRMLEQYLGEDGSATASAATWPATSTGTPRPPTCGTPWRTSGEPVRRIAESWIFRGGFPEVAVDRDGADVGPVPQRRFGYERRRRAAGRRPLGGAAHRRAPGGGPADGTDDAERGAPAARRRLGGGHLPAPTWPWVNANFGAHGFYRARYDPELLLEALLADLDGMTPLERYVLVDDAWASVLAGRPRRRRLRGHGRALRRRGRPVGVGAHRGRLEPDRPPGGGRRVHAAQPGGGPDRPRPGRAEDDARPDDDDRTRTLRGLLLKTAAVLATDPGAGAGPAAARPVPRRPGERRAQPGGPGADRLGHPGRRGPARAAGGDVRGRANPQDRERVLRSLARFRDPAALARTLDLTLSGDVRTQDARSCWPRPPTTATTPPRRGPSSPSTGTTLKERFPANSISRLVGGIRSIRDQAPWPTRSGPSWPTTPIPRASCRSASTSSAWG